MYGQIYTLPFKSIEENDYLVVIEKDGFTGSSTELTGSSSPFTVETSLDSPISPYRLSTATLKIFGGDYLQNLFTPNPQGVRVKLLKNNNIEWLGFVTNDTYSQDYSNVEFEYEIELVNPLSTLKYKKFNKTSDTITLYQLIIDAIKYTNSEIRKLYLSTSVTNELNQNIYELIFTASDNYIDEQGEPMNYYEILKEIAKYLCLTITIDKDVVYFLDYIGISKGYNSYYEYTFDSSYNVIKTQNPVTLINSTTIQTLDYSGNSSTLQINSGKNKAKVTCSLYEIDNDLIELTDENSEFKRMEILEDYYLLEKRPDGGKSWGTRYWMFRHYKHTDIDLYRYSETDNGISTPTITHDELGTTGIGSGFVRTADYLTKWRVGKPEKLNWTSEIMVRRYNSLANAQNGKCLIPDVSPVVTLRTKDTVLISPNAYLSVKFDFKATLEKEYVRNPAFEAEGVIKTKVKLKVGNLYYNGTDWTTTESLFEIPLDYLDKDYLYGNYISSVNNNTYDLGMPNASGYLVPTPNQIIVAKVELTLYDVLTPLAVMLTPGLESKYIYYNNIRVTYAIPSENIYGDYEEEQLKSKNDAVYENDIDDMFVDEAEEVELKICTLPDEHPKLCYSSTFINNQFLRTLKYSPLDVTDKPEIIIINKIIEYFKEPKYEVTIPINNKVIYPYTLVTDINLAGKTFIYAGNQIDYEFEKNIINLIQI